MLGTVLLILVLGLSIFASIAAWINTRTILRELSEMKNFLNIKDVRKPSYLDKDLDDD